MDSAVWDEKYRARPLLWSATPNVFVAEEVAGLKPGTALDVACGEGRNAVWLAQQGWDVTGVDFSSVAVERARTAAAERGVAVRWVTADVTTWEPDTTYDLVLVAYLQLPSAELDPLMKRMAGWVGPGGRILLVGHDRETAGVSGPGDPDLLWTTDRAEEWTEPFVIERSRTRHRKTDEGETATDTVVLARRH